jgi:hypothetical protein
MHKKTILLFLFMATCFFAMAQTQEAVTTSGKKVILYADGTWKYAEPVKAPGTKTEPVELKEKKKEAKKEPEKKEIPVAETGTGECGEDIEMIEDRRTGVRTRRVKNLIILSEPNSGKEIAILMQKGAREVITINFRPNGAGNCIAEGNKINIVFTDGSKLDLANDALTNCNGDSKVNFGGPYGRKKIFEELRSKKISSLKVVTQQGSVQLSVNTENADLFRRMFNCLASQ